MTPTPFVVLSQPRTGSTLLCSLLNSHPAIRAVVEPINPSNHSHQMKPLSGSQLLPERLAHENIERALNILFAPEPPFPHHKIAISAAGFKIMAHQIIALKSELAFWEYLKQTRVKTILCLRYNILYQYLSDLITRKTRQSACWDSCVKTTTVQVNIASLGNDLQHIIRQKQYLFERAAELDARYINYEDFKDDWSKIGDLAVWLVGGKRHHLTTKLTKQNPDSLKARVLNYAEFAVEIRRLGLDHLLE